MRGKQSVKKAIWHIGGKYKRAPKRRKQKGGAFSLGLLASVNAPILGEIAKPILGKILGRCLKRNGKKAHNFKKKIKSRSSRSTRR